MISKRLNRPVHTCVHSSNTYDSWLDKNGDVYMFLQVKAMADTNMDIVHKLESAQEAIAKVTALSHLPGHNSAISYCQNLQDIVRPVDWVLPILNNNAKHTKHDADQAAQSLATAGRGCQALSQKLNRQLEQHKQARHQNWAQEDRSTADGFKLAGHIIGPLTLGLGYLFWTGFSTCTCRLESHCNQELQALQDVSSVLQHKVKPVIDQYAAALEAAAENFSNRAYLEAVQKVDGKT